MKVERRSVPLDVLSVSEVEYRVTISTHHHSIVVDIKRDNEWVMNEHLTLPEFVSLLMSRTKER